MSDARRVIALEERVSDFERRQVLLLERIERLEQIAGDLLAASGPPLERERRLDA